MAISSLKHHKKYLLALLLAVVIVGVGLKAFHVGPFHKKVVVVSASSFNTKGEGKNSGNSPGTKQNSQSGGSGTSSTSSKSSASLSLFTPSGNFISNHHPNLSGTPAPNTMSSVCNTTPGATCKITFTKDGVTKSLASQTADSNGAVYWNWKLQDIDLTAGSWNVQAIASLNGQTKSASDAMDLTVSP